MSSFKTQQPELEGLFGFCSSAELSPICLNLIKKLNDVTMCSSTYHSHQASSEIVMLASLASVKDFGFNFQSVWKALASVLRNGGGGEHQPCV